MKKRILAVTALMMSAAILPVQASDSPATEQTEDLTNQQTAESSEQSGAPAIEQDTGSPATGEVVIMDVTTSPKYSYQETEAVEEETDTEEEKVLPKTGDFSFFEKIREAISNFFYRK